MAVNNCVVGSPLCCFATLGAVVGVMMWFYVSALAVLVGAELNAYDRRSFYGGTAKGYTDYPSLVEAGAAI